MITQTLSGKLASMVHDEIMANDRWSPLREGLRQLANTIQIRIDQKPERARLAASVIETVEMREARTGPWPSSSRKAIASAKTRLATFADQ